MRPTWNVATRVFPLASRCGSTSVACCPGAIVKGSELICARFAPTGFPGGGGGGGEVVSWAGEDEPEHPDNTSIRKAAMEAATRLRYQEHATLTLLIPHKCDCGLIFVNRLPSSCLAENADQCAVSWHQ